MSIQSSANNPDSDSEFLQQLLENAGSEDLDEVKSTFQKRLEAMEEKELTDTSFYKIAKEVIDNPDSTLQDFKNINPQLHALAEEINKQIPTEDWS